MADCLFCKIVAGEIPAELVAESGRTIAFRDINPQAPTHVLVIPKDHHPDLAALAAADGGLLAEVAAQAHQVAEAEGVSATATGSSSTPGRRPGRRCSTRTPTCWAAGA